MAGPTGLAVQFPEAFGQLARGQLVQGGKFGCDVWQGPKLQSRVREPPLLSADVGELYALAELTELIMALERGGRGDKLGNRYEGLWVARQLLSVIGGELRSVRVEAIGDDEEGVDLWVTDNDGIREAQQCKADHHAGKWSISDLARRGVLGHLKKHLTANPQDRFTLVTGVPAAELADLAERAASSATPRAFLEHQVSGQRLRPAFRAFCSELGLKPVIPEDIALAHDLLRRTRVHLVARDHESRRDVEARASYHLVGDPRLAVAFLADFAHDHFDRELHANTLLAALPDGLKPRDLMRESNLVPRLCRLNGEFEESIAPTLIAGKLIPRPEADRLVARIGASDKKPFTVLHGRAGDGKSGVLLQLVQHLRVSRTPYLAIRLDRRLPRSSARRYGEEELDLPASPAHCLGAMASGRSCVLILDQLDAVRWTAAHANAAWETCREVIEQASTFPSMNIILACRTFDWREDPQLMHWEGRSLCEEIEIGALPDEAVEQVVRKTGGDYAALDRRQRQLLQSAHCLSLWTTLQQDREAPAAFRTPTDLMKAFWANRRERMTAAGVASADVNAAIEEIVCSMDNNGCLAVPARLIDRHPAAARELKSLNVVTVSGQTVSFAHQTYLDFLVAERLLGSGVRSADQVLGWLEGHEQSLFRREQFRQMLVLLRDEDPAVYLQVLKRVLDASNKAVRFHMKHLVLQHLRQCEPPNDDEIRVVIGLLDQHYWRDHVLQLTLFRSSGWLRALAAAGVLGAQLAASDEAVVNSALGLLWGAAETDGDTVAQLLKPYLSQPKPWLERIASVVNLHECENSRPLFEVRCNCERRGLLTERYLWCQKLATSQPAWCAELLEARFQRIIDDWPTALDQEHGQAGEFLFPLLLATEKHPYLEDAARAAGGAFWDRLVPCVERLLSIAGRLEAHDEDTYWRDEVWYGNKLHIHVTKDDLVRLLAIAGGALAKSDPSGFLARVQTLSSSSARTVQRLILSALVEAPPSLANEALTWICQDAARFRLDVPPGDGKWALARQLLERFSAHASEETYRRLETAILQYHEDWEFDSFRWRHEDQSLRRRLCPNYYGGPQRALLSALSKNRMSDAALNLVGQLERKFSNPVPALDDEDVRMLPVESVISDTAVARLNDKTWLELITRKPREGGRSIRSHDCFLSTEPLLLARQLTGQVRRQPKRFAKIALKVPPEVHVYYISSILEGLAQTEPPEGTADATWAPVGVEDLEPVLRHFSSLQDDEAGKGIAGLLETRAELAWSDEVLALLSRLAVDHPDPRPGEIKVHWPSQADDDDNVIHEALTTALNSVRGKAAYAIAKVLEAQPHRFDRLKFAVERLVEDPELPVRAAALMVCVALLREHRDVAAKLFFKAANPVGLVLATHYADRLVAALGHTHLKLVVPLLKAMAASETGAVATMGAARAMAAWLQWNVLGEEVIQYTSGSAAQRKGVAIVAAKWIDDEKYRRRCLELLPSFFNDPEKDVRTAAAGVFSQAEVFELQDIPALALHFVKSLAFPENAGHFLHNLEDHTGSLAPYTETILEICRSFSGEFAQESRDLRSRLAGDAHQLAPLLLRRYEQAQDSKELEVQRACLNAWDQMLEARVGGTSEALASMGG